MKIDDLKFYVKRYDSNKKEFVDYNIFDSLRVIRSVATYRAMTPKRRGEIPHPLSFCFGDLWGRFEWEFEICPLFEENKCQKMDAYKMYIEPNANYLLELVNSVSSRSAKNWLKKYCPRKNS